MHRWPQQEAQLSRPSVSVRVARNQTEHLRHGASSVREHLHRRSGACSRIIAEFGCWNHEQKNAWGASFFSPVEYLCFIVNHQIAKENALRNFFSTTVDRVGGAAPAFRSPEAGGKPRTTHSCARRATPRERTSFTGIDEVRAVRAMILQPGEARREVLQSFLPDSPCGCKCAQRARGG